MFDLSDTSPSDVSFGIDRVRGDGGGWRPITLLLNGSLLDVPHTFTHALLELIDLDTDCRTIFDPESKVTARPTVSTESKDSFKVDDREVDCFSPFKSEDDNVTASAPSVRPESWLLTLLTRESSGHQKAQKITPLCVPETIKHLLKPGRKYCLQTNSIDLGEKWWRYGSQAELSVKDVPQGLFHPSETATLLATQLCHRDFSVVESLPVPPSVYISLVLSSPAIYRSGDAITILKISVTNLTNQPVTMVSVDSQPYVLPHHAQSNNHACVISTSANISPGNFSTTHVAFRKELVQKSRLCVLQSRWQRRQFTTLEPVVRLVQKIGFLKNATAVRARMELEKYKLKPRARGVWWHWGTKDEVLERKPGITTLPRSRHRCWHPRMR